MKQTDRALARLREICLALPDTKETITWGEPHFRVGEKIFAGYGKDAGRSAIGFKLEPLHAEEVLDDPRFTRAAYVGRYGWVAMDAGQVSDWDEVRELVHESYRLIAPRRSLKKLAGGSTPAPAAKRTPTRRRR